MSYKATIASASRDDPIMGKSFVMACDGPFTSWYSYLQPLSVASWHNLKEKLRQDFQVFKKMDVTSMEDFQCIQMDREPLLDYLRKFIQKKTQTPNFSEKAEIDKCIDGLLLSQLASHLSRELK